MRLNKTSITLDILGFTAVIIPFSTIKNILTSLLNNVLVYDTTWFFFKRNLMIVFMSNVPKNGTDLNSSIRTQNNIRTEVNRVNTRIKATRRIVLFKEIYLKDTATMAVNSRITRCGIVIKVIDKELLK